MIPTMKLKHILLFLIFSFLALGCISGAFAALSDDANVIKNVSIGV